MQLHVGQCVQEKVRRKQGKQLLQNMLPPVSRSLEMVLGQLRLERQQLTEAHLVMLQSRQLTAPLRDIALHAGQCAQELQSGRPSALPKESRGRVVVQR